MAKKPRYGAAGVNMPGYPSNVMLTPQAASQVAARQAGPLFLPRGSFTVNGVNPYPELQQNMAQLPQQQQPNGLQGPLAGLVQRQGFNPLQTQAQSPTLPAPVMNQQNTAIPQGQVLHRTGRQRGGLGRFFLGSRPEVFNSPNFTPFQSEILNYLLQYGVGGLQDLDQNQFDFAPIGNQELERFYTQTIPSLAERFTAMGGGQRSSAFQGALANAGRFLGNDLAAQQQQYNLQQQGMEQNLISTLLNLGLAPQFAQNLNPGGGGLFPGLVKAGTEVGKAFAGGAGLASGLAI